jgi:hypothetical protein
MVSVIVAVTVSVGPDMVVGIIDVTVVVTDIV